MRRSWPTLAQVAAYLIMTAWVAARAECKWPRDEPVAPDHHRLRVSVLPHAHCRAQHGGMGVPRAAGCMPRSTSSPHLVILMTMSEFASVADAKAHLSELVSRVGTQHDRVTVTVHGRPTAVLLAVDDLDALEETIAVLSDTTTVQALAAADSELARGEGETEDALRDAMRARRASA